MGHTMSIHSRNDQVILEFGLHKPAYRIVVNTPTTHGSIGLSTGLDPAMTLGCGGFGGNITSDNISPKHLLNIKRVAYETRPVTRTGASGAEGASGAAGAGVKGAGAKGAASAARGERLPQAPGKPAPEPIAAEALTRRIDAFLASRGIAGAAAAPPALSAPSAPVAPAPEAPSAPPAAQAPWPFVCEDDVRSAVKAGTTILIGEKTIVTPAARDAGEAAKVFRWQSYRS
jgi:acetaldehyde dehydrogenase (acetylating)